MKVLYLGTDLFMKGGIQRYSRYQIDALRRTYGADSVRVLGLSGPGADAFEEPLETTWIAGGVGIRERLRYAVQALRVARRERPDIVLAAHVSVSPLAVMAARICGGRCVLNVYGLEMWSGLRPRDRVGLGRVHHLISDCHFTARFVNEELGIAQGATDVVWDCVDLDRFTPGAPDDDVVKRYGLELDPGELRIMTLGRVSRVSRHKGYERMIEVVAGLGDRVRLRYVVAGTGDFVDSLRQLARDRGVDEKVTFTGSIHERDLVEIYRSSDIFALVSDRGRGRGEGIPLTPLEAAACGVPILVGNHDGSQEAVVDGENGYVLDPFDLDGIADRITRLHDRPELRREMGLAARRRAEDEHSLATFRARTARALERALVDSAGDSDVR